MIGVRARIERAGSWLLCGLGAVLPFSLGLSNVFLVAACAAAVLVGIGKRPRQWRRWRFVLIGLSALVLTHCLATLFSPQPNWHTTIEELWIKSLLFVVPCLGGSGGRDGQRGLHVFSCVAVAVAAFAVGQHFYGWDPWRGGSVAQFGTRYQSVGFFGHHLSYGGHLLVVLSLLLAQMLWGTRRRLAAVGLAIVLLALLWSYARSAQLGAIAAVLALIFRSQGQLRRRATLALLGVVILVAVIPSTRARWAQFGSIRSDTTRMLIWQSSLDGIRDRPWLGYGPGNFKLFLAEHERPGDYESRAHAHNDLLMFAVNAGLPAAAAAILLWIGCWRMASRRSNSPPTALTARAVLACLVAFAVAGLFQVYQTDDEVELSLYYLLGHGLREVG